MGSAASAKRSNGRPAARAASPGPGRAAAGLSGETAQDGTRLANEGPTIGPLGRRFYLARRLTTTKLTLGTGGHAAAHPDGALLGVHLDAARTPDLVALADGDVGVGAPAPAGEQPDGARGRAGARVLGHARPGHEHADVQRAVVEAAQRAQADAARPAATTSGRRSGSSSSMGASVGTSTYALPRPSASTRALGAGQPEGDATRVGVDLGEHGIGLAHHRAVGVGLDGDRGARRGLRPPLGPEHPRRPERRVAGERQLVVGREDAHVVRVVAP